MSLETTGTPPPPAPPLHLHDLGASLTERATGSSIEGRSIALKLHVVFGGWTTCEAAQPHGLDGMGGEYAIGVNDVAARRPQHSHCCSSASTIVRAMRRRKFTGRQHEIAVVSLVESPRGFSLKVANNNFRLSAQKGAR